MRHLEKERLVNRLVIGGFVVSTLLFFVGLGFGEPMLRAVGIAAIVGCVLIASEVNHARSRDR